VISFNPAKPFEYKNGLRNPIGGSLAFNLTSFNNATNPVKAGDEADVPPMRKAWPPMKILNKSDCAETSGKALTRPG